MWLLFNYKYIYDTSRESVREKGIKLVSQICDNIINNPSQTEKFGKLNFDEINKKLTSCKPALDLLFIAGFNKLSIDNKTRLLWTNTNDNLTNLTLIHQILSLNNEQRETHITLINSGLTDQEAIDTILMRENDTYICIGFVAIDSI